MNTTTNTPLKFVMPSWFALVMGLCGLALAWKSATPLLGDTASGVALVLGVLALGVFVVVGVASVVRLLRYPEAVQEDLRHPIRHAFFAAIPISMMLLATVAHALQIRGLGVHVLWLVGSLVQVWVTVWALGSWLQGSPAGKLWPSITPVLFIPVVGNVLAPLAGVGLGYSSWAYAQMGIGLLFWPVVLTLLIARVIQHSPLPDRILPTWMITVAPPAVLGIDMLHAGLPGVSGALWGVALFFVLWASTLAKRMAAQHFALPFWGLSFPLAAFSALSLQLANTPAYDWLYAPALVALAVTSLVILGLVLGTVRGLRNGSLLAPEVVAPIVAAPADTSAPKA